MAMHGIDGMVDGAVVGRGHLVLVLLVRLVAGSTGGFSRRDDETPEQILKRRYAKGEIDSEEYQHRLADLRR